MNKGQLIDRLLERRGGSDIESKAAAERIVTDVLELIADGIETDGSAHFVGFGSFDVVRRAERNGTDPQTREAIKIPACKTVRFRPSQALKDRAEACDCV